LIPEAQDFLQESNALYSLLEPLGDKDLNQITQFRYWTISDVIQHLLVWNRVAYLSLSDEDLAISILQRVMAQEFNFRALENELLDGLQGRELIQTWQKNYTLITEGFASADPKRRLKWAGPSMSARSSVSARLMETWAHGQEIYDILAVKRVDTDRILSIAHLGVNTFGWTYSNRGQEIPAQRPNIELIAPSGDHWTWSETDSDNNIFGNAVDFCQVVTQTRNIHDTNLKVEGDVAKEWMATAQCFAGDATDPPAPGSRYRLTI